MFLKPDKIPNDAKKATLIDHLGKDTLIIQFGENYQPTFTDRNEAPAKLGYKVENALFNNSIGNQLNGWIISPKEEYNGTTVLFLHGNAGNIVTQFTGVLPLVRQGFAVFIFDYSGFGFSDGKATRNNVLLDATAAFEYLLKQQNVSYDNLIIYGQSLGGHLATKIAAQNQNHIDGLVVEGAFSSHKDIAAETAGILGRILVSEKYSGIKSIGEFQKPVLIIHSTEDETIPFEHGKKLFDNANEPKNFFEIDKCHICGLTYYSDSIAVKINEMIKTVSP
jgi:alpha-beta hydrolase superfamily lysophospholipase